MPSQLPLPSLPLTTQLEVDWGTPRLNRETTFPGGGEAPAKRSPPLDNTHHQRAKVVTLEDTTETETASQSPLEGRGQQHHPRLKPIPFSNRYQVLTDAPNEPLCTSGGRGFQNPRWAPMLSQRREFAGQQE